MKNIRISATFIIMVALLAVTVAWYWHRGRSPTTDTIIIDRTAQRGPVALADLPKPVVLALQQSIPGGAPTQARNRIEDDVRVFDIDGTVSGRHFDMLIAPDGTVVELNEEMKPDAIPPAVSAAVNKSFPKSTINYIERQEKNQRTIYEIKLTVGSAKGTVEFLPDGSIHRQKLKAPPATAPA